MKIQHSKVRLIKLTLSYNYPGEGVCTEEEKITYLTIPYNVNFDTNKFEEFIAERTGNTAGVLDYKWENMGETLHIDKNFDRELKKRGSF